MADEITGLEVVSEPPDGNANGNGNGNGNGNATATMNAEAQEVFRGMWASVFYSSRTTGKAVMICSADSREGTSTIAAGLGLAGSLPTGISRVALVDFNLRRPALHKIFGLDPNGGVAEMVLNGTTVQQAARAVSRGLDVFTTGNVNGGTLDILRSARLPEVLTELTAAYDQVLIDAPPVNENADSLVLSTLVNDTVIVTYAEKTPREAVAVAKKRLEAAGTNVIGVVLNLRVYPIPRFLYSRV